MPAKASLGGGAPRAAWCVGSGGRSVAFGEVSPFVMSHRGVGEGSGGSACKRGRLRGLSAGLVRVFLHLPDVVLRLGVRRPPAVALHGTRARVVGGERL